MNTGHSGSRNGQQRAAKLLSEATDETGDLDISKLVTKLQSDDTDVRSGATWALAEAARDWPHRTSQATGDIIALLDDDDQWVRRGASWALSEIAESAPKAATAGVDALNECLSDEDPLVRENATRAVAEVSERFPSRARPTVSELAKRLEDDDTLVRQYAAEALGNILGDVGIVEELEPATVHALAEHSDLIQKDIEVFETSEDESALESLAEQGPMDEPNIDRGSAPSRTRRENDRGPPEVVPDAPNIWVGHSDVQRVGGIGTGRTGVVYRARVRTEEDDHVIVALKRLRYQEFVDDEQEFEADFERAVAGWRRLSEHDHVVSVLGSDRHPGPWLALEYMDSASLRDRIGQVGFPEALWDGLSVVRAVSNAHAHGIVHGGIRPSNVLFSETLEGTWDVPKLTDWGLDDCFFEHATTRRWLDPTYAAPEQLMTDRFGTPDHASDVYQLGVLLYELFTGRPPFTGEPADVARQVVNDQPRPATELFSSLPSEIDQLFTRALAREKHERYETVEDLRRELELFVDEHAPELRR